jgi:ribosomal protein S19
MRSKWKIRYEYIKNRSNIKNLSNRRYIISKELLGEYIGVYNGKRIIKIYIKKEKIGIKIGEFIITKVLGLNSYYKKKKNKKK